MTLRLYPVELSFASLCVSAILLDNAMGFNLDTCSAVMVLLFYPWPSMSALCQHDADTQARPT